MKRTSRWVSVPKRLAPAAMLVVLAASFGLPSASAQDYQTRELIERLNRLERDLGDIQRQFYKGGAVPPSGTFAGSGDVGSTQAAELSVRINQLETELRTVTGSVERVDFEISKVRQRLDKLVADVDFRLTAIERQLAGGAKTAGQGGAGGEPGAGQAAELAPAARGKPKAGTLGTLPADATGQAAVAVPQGVLPQGGSAQDDYDFSFKLIRQGDYGVAEQAFREFLAVHGDSALAGNAQYWLAESFYVREMYEPAARAFLEGYQKYKGHGKAADSLLKLGMSLVRLDQKKEACATFDQLDAEFPNVDEIIKRQVAKERGQIGCK